MDAGGVQTTLHKVVESCGLKKDHAPQLAPQPCHHLIEAGVDLIEDPEVSRPPLHPHHRPLHLTDQTKHHALDRINGLMDGFGITWGKVK